MAKTTGDNRVDFVSTTELTTFASKLDAWADGLDPKERALLKALISKAMAGKLPEVEGQCEMTDLRMSVRRVLLNLRIGLVRQAPRADEGGFWAQWAQQQDGGVP